MRTRAQVSRPDSSKKSHASQDLMGSASVCTYCTSQQVTAMTMLMPGVTYAGGRGFAAVASSTPGGIGSAGAAAPAFVAGGGYGLPAASGTPAPGHSGALLCNTRPGMTRGLTRRQDVSAWRSHPCVQAVELKIAIPACSAQQLCREGLQAQLAAMAGRRPASCEMSRRRGPATRAALRWDTLHKPLHDGCLPEQ